MAVVIYLNTQKINDFSTQHKEKRWLESVLFVPDFSRFRPGGTALKLLGPVTSKIQQTKISVTCQRFGDLFLIGLVWQYSTSQNQYNKGIGSKSWLLTCSSNITLSLPSYTVPAL